ncbi:unnamed protein product [Adineta ricciae]|uniref:Uncharacterized protein n=1 Tax=Adineta ricciae TaxID=249248 RepID=A0A813SPQ8_ADIRI|nr:unnamed protein product [Adineta ricciae]
MLKSNKKIKRRQQLTTHSLSLFEQEKYRIYSHAIRTLQTSKSFAPSSSKQRHIYRISYKAIYGIFIVCHLASSAILLWMIILNIEGIHVEAKVRDSIEYASSDLIAFTECITSKLNCLFNPFSNQTDQIRFNQIWNRMFINLAERLRIWATIFDFRLSHSLTIALAVMFLITFDIVFYFLLKKLHWSRRKVLNKTKIAFILSIIYWIGFVFWFTKLVILLPHVAGVCSACTNFKTIHLYNSLFYTSEWFNSTFPSILNNETANINQMIQDCQQKMSFWTTNDLSHKNNESLSSEHLDHCYIIYQLYDDFMNLFCHSFIKHLFHYLIASLLNMLTHLILYLLSILLRRFIQNHKCQFARWNISLRSSSFSVIRPVNANNHDDDEIEQGV